MTSNLENPSRLFTRIVEGLQRHGSKRREIRQPPLMKKASSQLDETADFSNLRDITKVSFRSPKDPSNRRKAAKMAKTFRFMDLPAELREIIYYHAFTPIKPIDTAAIPNTPDRVRIHPIAQLNLQTREESLHVLFRSRPTEISLHSDENVRRALVWARKWKDHARALPSLIFSGRIRKHQFQFFHITMKISDEAPYFTASARDLGPFMDHVAEMKRDMLVWLESKLSGADEGRPAKLSGAELVELINLVAEAADALNYDHSSLAQHAMHVERAKLVDCVEIARRHNRE